MQSDLWISLTMKVMALGHPLRDAQRIAAMLLIGRLVICTLMGFRLPADEPARIPAAFPATRGQGTGGAAGIRGIFPAITGTAADDPRALLSTQ